MQGLKNEGVWQQSEEETNGTIEMLLNVIVHHFPVASLHEAPTRVHKQAHPVPDACMRAVRLVSASLSLQLSLGLAF